MIKSFAHKGLKKFFLTGNKAGIQPRHASRIRLILAQLNQARFIEDMNIPTLKLHELKGEKKEIDIIKERRIVVRVVFLDIRIT